MLVHVADEEVAGQTHVEAGAVQALQPRSYDVFAAVVAEERLAFAQLVVAGQTRVTL